MPKEYGKGQPRIDQPGPDNRILNVGKTGSGKTVAGIFHLSNSNFNEVPWIVFDYKKDAAIQSIDYVPLSVEAPPPARPGIYVCSPLPNEREETERLLWKVWENGSTGIYADEGYMIAPSREGKSKAFRAIMTQGRSLRIPVIINSQRPVEIDRFCISEAEFFQIFKLNDEADRKRVQSFLNKSLVDVDAPLPRFHSWYYDVNNDSAAQLAPVPPPDETVARINRRLAKLRSDTEQKARKI